MPAEGRLLAPMRILRLAAALSLIVALAAIATIVNGDAPAKSRALVAVAVLLGAVALLGMAGLALPYVRRKKDPDDPRS